LVGTLGIDRGLSYAFLVLCTLLIKMQFACKGGREGGREGALSQIMLPKTDPLYKAFLFVQKTFIANSMIFLKRIAKF
jgi:hypothetical protein